MIKIGIFLLALGLTFAGLASDSPFNTDISDAIEIINARLSHSRIIGIDEEGMVKIKAPGQIIEFPIRDVAFNYNDSDHRVRVAGIHNIKYYEDGRLVEVSHRQSFTCGSTRMAQDVIDSFRTIRNKYLGKNRDRDWEARGLPVADGALGFQTLGQAVDFINDSFCLSVVVNLEQNRELVINAPSAIYRVDMNCAQFAVNDWSGRPSVRIFGDWCVEMTAEDGRRNSRLVPRESFTVCSPQRARQSVLALSYIKGTLLGHDVEQIEENANQRRVLREDFNSIEEAVDFINDRLEISIITNIDEHGMVTVNAPENIYQFPLSECRFRPGRNRISIFGFEISGRRRDSVEIRCNKGLELYFDRRLQRREESENFSVKGRHEVREVIEALEYIQNKLK